MKWHCCRSSHILVLLCRRKELLHLGLHFHLKGEYFIPFTFPHCEKLALFYNLNFTEVYINLQKFCYSSAEHYVISVYFNVWGEGGVNFMKHFKGVASCKYLGTSDLDA
jgi:hypothetical protein